MEFSEKENIQKSSAQLSEKENEQENLQPTSGKEDEFEKHFLYDRGSVEKSPKMIPVMHFYVDSKLPEKNYLVTVTDNNTVDLKEYKPKEIFKKFSFLVRDITNKILNKETDKEKIKQKLDTFIRINNVNVSNKLHDSENQFILKVHASSEYENPDDRNANNIKFYRHIFKK